MQVSTSPEPVNPYNEDEDCEEPDAVDLSQPPQPQPPPPPPSNLSRPYGASVDNTPTTTGQNPVPRTQWTTTMTWKSFPPQR